MIKCMLSPYDEGQSVFGSLYEIEVIKSAFFKLTKTEKGSIGSREKEKKNPMSYEKKIIYEDIILLLRL